MGPTDGSWAFGGWNIDDVEVFGIPAPVGSITNQPSSFLLSARYDASNSADVLSWASQSNQVYRLDFTRVLSRSFQPVATNLPATPPLNSYTNQPSPAGSTRFYRVHAQY